MGESEFGIPGSRSGEHPVTPAVPGFEGSAKTIDGAASKRLPVLLYVAVSLHGYEPENTVVVARWACAPVTVRCGKIDNACGIFGDVAKTPVLLIEYASCFSVVTSLLAMRMPQPQAAVLAKALSEGRCTHDYPITVLMVREFGLPVSTEMPKLVYELMDLYPQAAPAKSRGTLYSARTHQA